MRKQSSTRAKVIAAAPRTAGQPGRTSLRRLLAFAVLGACAFAVSYGLVALSRWPFVPTDGPPGMNWIPGGEFTMGTNSEQLAWADEKPAHRVRVDGFWMDLTEVTNDQFRAFVDATNYVTTAEKPPDVEELLKQLPPGTPPPPKEKLVPGSLVFQPTKGPVDTRDFSQWWQWTPGANWRHPEGPGSDLASRGQHPVVQVSWDDAVAYAQWAGKRLPTEAEWEFAARGGLESKLNAWGDEPLSQEKPQANTWQGEFPYHNLATDGFERTAPVKSFAPNGFGLYDVSGNVWEWCADWYDRELYKRRAGQGVTVNPTGPTQSIDPQRPYMPQRNEAAHFSVTTAIAPATGQAPGTAAPQTRACLTSVSGAS